MKSINFWLHLVAQLAAQAVAFNLPEPAGKWVALLAAVTGAIVAWYDTTYSKTQAPQ